MDWTTGLKKALAYIEANLEQPLDIASIAREAACSPYYFQRIFSVLCGLSVGEYIRGRRLTLAGNLLATTNIKVIDAAIRYGYESPESFTRAFSAFHGFPPSEAKRHGAKLQYMMPLSLYIQMKGGTTMQYTVIQKPAFTVLEKAQQFPISLSPLNNLVPAFWDACADDGTLATLQQLLPKDGKMLGLCYSKAAAPEAEFTYAIGIVAPAGTPTPAGFTLRNIPAHTWLVFSCTGPIPAALQSTWQRIVSEFMPTAPFRPTYEMDIEVYPAGDQQSPTYQSEIWLPVVPID